MTSSMGPASDLARSEELLRQAAQTENMAERGRLIDQAAWWRFRAAEGDRTAGAANLEDAAIDPCPASPERPAVRSGGV